MKRSVSIKGMSGLMVLTLFIFGQCGPCTPCFTLSVGITGQGSVDPPGGPYGTGTVLTLTATPASGWSFDHWEGALSGNTNPASLPLDFDKSVTAVFTQPNSVDQAIQEIIADDTRFATQTPLAAADYQALAEKMAAVPGVESAQYVGDVLGSIQIEVKDGGLLMWRHIEDTFQEASLLPANLVVRPALDPEWNKGWGTPVEVLPNAAADKTIRLNRNLQCTESNTYATHFPCASGNPDPEYLSDDTVPRVEEGKIAIVDFQWTAGPHGADLYTDPAQFMVDGVMLYDRIRMMGEAAHFTVDIYKDNQINLQNFDTLNQYTIVIIIAHGGNSGPKPSRRLNTLFSTIGIADKYEPAKPMLGPNGIIHQEDGWNNGYIIYNLKDKSVALTSLYFRDVYKTRSDVPQMWMVNSCHALQPFRTTIETSFLTGPELVPDLTGPVYNIANGLMASGAKVVFGYQTAGNPLPIQYFTMSFFRRLFGGYFKDDRPPPPHVFWPTCMSAQTFFRDPANPSVSSYRPKQFTITYPDGNKANFLYIMYAVSTPQYLRKVCNPDNPQPHWALQSFMLQVGTPATAFTTCWDNYWQAGDCPNFIQDQLCSKGNCSTTDSDCKNAANAVKIARKVTNEMLR